MYYLFTERNAEDAQLFEGDLPELERATEGFRVLGWSTTILDEEERVRYRALTEHLIAQRPDLA